MNCILIVHYAVVKWLGVEIQSLDLLHRQLLLVVKQSVVLVPGQLVDNMALIHEVEGVLVLHAEGQALLGLELVDCLVLVNVLISWVSFHDVTLSILLGNVVDEVSLIHHQPHLFKAELPSDVFVVFHIACILLVGVFHHLKLVVHLSHER